MSHRIFVDSDVVISALLSTTGAAHLVVTKKDQLTLFISNFSTRELERVGERLAIKKRDLSLMLEGLHTIDIQSSLQEVKSEYKKYVLDQNDAHIVAGAVASNAQFLITYNSKDFLVDKIKQDFDIIVTSPGYVLQYLRST